MTAHVTAGLDPCVHCGFCLQSCPTYLVTLDEADSPRGRIVLMRGVEAGALSPRDPHVQRHLDRCLGCRACEPACPSGIEYGHSLEAAREALFRARPIPWIQRAIHAVMSQSRSRRPLLAAARLLRPVATRLAGRSRLGFAMGMLGATRMDGRAVRSASGSRRARAGDPPHRRAALFLGCIQDSLFGHVHAASSRVLEVNGYQTLDVPGQGCCGALHAHAGQLDEARRLARANVRAFASLPADVAIAVDAAGCGAMLKEYGYLLRGEPEADAAQALADHVRDVTELLASQGPRPGAANPVRVAYDPPCHLLHAQGVADAPLTVLGAIPELVVVAHEEAAVCCGSAGTYGLVQPGISRQVLDRKLDALLAAAPEVIATGNPGCTMQIGAGLMARGIRTPVVHPVELLDWSYACAGYYDH